MAAIVAWVVAWWITEPVPIPVTSLLGASLALVGLTASLLVLLTGRLWPAVLAHVVYNGLWVAMATVGTLLAA